MTVSEGLGEGVLLWLVGFQQDNSDPGDYWIIPYI